MESVVEAVPERGGGGGVLPYVSHKGSMCHPIG